MQEGGGLTKEVMERLASFEKKLNIQSARTGIKAELRRQQAQIIPEKNWGSSLRWKCFYDLFGAKGLVWSHSADRGPECSLEGPDIQAGISKGRRYY
jgi:hypothetical protein